MSNQQVQKNKEESSLVENIFNTFDLAVNINDLDDFIKDMQGNNKQFIKFLAKADPKKFSATISNLVGNGLVKQAGQFIANGFNYFSTTDNPQNQETVDNMDDLFR